MTAQPLVASCACHATAARPHGHRPLHVRPVPDIDAPPITDVVWEEVGRPRAPIALQPTLPFADQPPAEHPGIDRARRRTGSTSVVRGLPRRDEVSFDRRPTSTAELPDVRVVAGSLGAALVEIAGGARHATQVMRYCTPEVFESLLRRTAHRAGRAARRRPVVVRRVQVCHVRDGVAEVCVVVADAHRVRPLALRLEGLDGRWMLTVVEWG